MCLVSVAGVGTTSCVYLGNRGDWAERRGTGRYSRNKARQLMANRNPFAIRPAPLRFVCLSVPQRQRNCTFWSSGAGPAN